MNLKNSLPDEDSSTALTPEPERQARAKKYARITRLLSVAELFEAGIVLSLLTFGGLSKEITASFNTHPVASAVLYFIILIGIYGIVSAPLSYYRGFILARRYGLSKQGFTGWLSDYIKAGILVSSLGTAIVALAYWFMAVQPQVWWLLIWGLLLVISFILSFLAPVVIVPIFFRMKPLGDAGLRERLERLATRAGVTVGGIYTIEFSSKSNTANAALMGTGKTRRIALSDTLLDRYSPEEIEVIMAHELGHHKNRDFMRLFLWQAALLFISIWLTYNIARAMVVPLGFSGIDDIAAMPLIALVIVALNLLLMPFSNTYIRNRERAADDFALHLVAQPQAFITMMAKLTDQNLAEAEPGSWVERLLYDHPSPRRRIEHARSYLKETVEGSRPDFFGF
jgi:STE24 endopeptidase